MKIHFLIMCPHVVQLSAGICQIYVKINICKMVGSNKHRAFIQETAVNFTFTLHLAVHSCPVFKMLSFIFKLQTK